MLHFVVSTAAAGSYLSHTVWREACAMTVPAEQPQTGANSSSFYLAATTAAQAVSRPRFLTVAEAAKRLGVSASYVNAECRAGRLRHLMVGSRRRIGEIWLKEWVEAHTKGGRH